MEEGGEERGGGWGGGQALLTGPQRTLVEREEGEKEREKNSRDEYL